MSHSTDPWERRDEERKRFQKKQGEPRNLFEELNHYQNPLILVLCLTILLAGEIPSISPQIRLLLSIGGTIGLLLLSFFSKAYAESFVTYIKRAPNILLFICLIWGMSSYYRSPNQTMGWGEIIRLMSGFLSYYVASMVLKNKKDLFFVIVSILIITACVAIYDVSHYARTVGLNSHFSADNVSILGTHESIGSLLALLLPLSMSLGLSLTQSERLRLFANAISLIIGFAWIMVRCRSAWLGGAFGLLAMGFFLWRSSLGKEVHSRGKNLSMMKRMIASPSGWIIIGLVSIALFGGLAPALSDRLGSSFKTLDDSSLSGRLIMWGGALRMLSEKPIVGWGLGSFLLLQGHWTNLGDSPEQVVLYGTGHQNIAHNYYLQWAAETGSIGLFLFLVSVSVLLVSGMKALFLARRSEDKTLLIACLSALLGALVEVNGSPAFQFCGVWSVFWTIAGILMAAIRLVEQDTPVHVSRRYYGIITVFIAMICAGAVWYGNRLWDPRGMLRGTFQLLERTKGPYYPGGTARWRATYRDGRGKEQGSHPGTIWVAPVWLGLQGEASPKPFQSQDWQLMREIFSTSDLLRGFSEFSLRLPASETGTVQIQAVFQDEFGRKYVASRVIDVIKK